MLFPGYLPIPYWICTQHPTCQELPHTLFHLFSRTHKKTNIGQKRYPQDPRFRCQNFKIFLGCMTPNPPSVALRLRRLRSCRSTAFISVPQILVWPPLFSRLLTPLGGGGFFFNQLSKFWMLSKHPKLSFENQSVRINWVLKWVWYILW